MIDAVKNGGSQWESHASEPLPTTKLQIPETDRTDKKAKRGRIPYTVVQRKGGVAWLKITGRTALVDECDLARLDGVSLSVKVAGRRGEQRPYVRCDFRGRRGQDRYAALHRYLTGAPAGCKVDHENGNGLDNRRINLRISDSTGNACNRRVNRRKAIPLKGVLATATGFRARITIGRKTRSLGVFQTAEAAARAYDAAAVELHGEFACLNFPQLTASYPAEQTLPYGGTR